MWSDLPTVTRILDFEAESAMHADMFGKSTYYNTPNAKEGSQRWLLGTVWMK